MSDNIKNTRKITIQRLIEMKGDGEKISMLTAYDYSLAFILDKTKIDVVLVGDSASNVMAGNVNTLPITLNQMIWHAKSVRKAVQRALLCVDMPFGSYQGSSKKAVYSAIRIIKETGADSVKIEGGKEVQKSIERILSAGIPIMGHLGLTPQSINKFGTYTVRAKEENEAQKLIDDAFLLEKLGCFSIVLEKIPAELGRKVAKNLSIPTIGIGAGPYVDGQVLVLQDMLGISKDFAPRFVRRYVDLYSVIKKSIEQYVQDVKNIDFPNKKESYWQ
ncbi:MAG: 3-methyl-2-oxobutanoate hydroxymethyltransferase [Bacteroidales bacterium OttesenSCG-928-I14]|jgi:3-methyl-2-oxobutanoate hydroxymethyltransferase|nr:3-methyl-2-oxobutanoate hydroxymethyltransferase [Bacteroidales bacterium OttesenSCG-928-I14]